MRILYADAWELYPTIRWGNNYITPIGEDLVRNLDPTAPPPALSPPCTPADTNSFKTVSVNVQAIEDNTSVEIDPEGDGSFEQPPFILNQGEQRLRSGILAGAEVKSSAPVQVLVIATDPCRQWELRGYNLIPRDQWTNDYLAPRSSDGDFWLYNPNGSDLLVTAETIAGPTTINILAGTTAKYPPAGLSTATGVHFTASDDFYGVAALDASFVQDWGYALLPLNTLTTQTLIGWGVSNDNTPPGPGNGGDGSESQVFVTALANTTIQVRYANGNTFSLPVNALEETPIVDPTNTYDMTGAFIFTTDGTPFVSVWGQRDGAPDATPSIDVGTSVVPLPSLLLQKTFRIKDDVDCTGTVTLGDTVEFKLQYFNNTANLVRSVIISDTLPSAVTYVPNSTQLNNIPLADGSNGTPFLFDEGGYNVGDIPPVEDGFVTFDVRINDVSGTIINLANARSEDLPLGSDSEKLVTTTQATPPLLAVNKTLIDPADGLVVSGQTITFSLAITNNGTDTIVSLPLQDTFNEAHLSFLNATLPPDITASGVITWNDLTSTLGDLSPGATFNVTANFVVDQIPATITNTLNTLIVVGARRSNSPTPLTCRDQALVRIPEPAIHVKKATNGFDADNPNVDPVPQIKPGDPVTWDYAVTNIGSVPLSNVTLVDDQLALLGVTPTFIGGDTNNDSKLDLDEIWTYQATGIAEDLPNSDRPSGQCGPGGRVSPIYTNMATTTGQFGPTIVTDDDPSHYCPPPDTGCRGNCSEPPPTAAPAPPPPPAPPPSSVTSPPPLPVIFLPETGTKEAFQGGPVVVGVTLLVMALTLLSVGLLQMRSRVKDKTCQRK